MLKEKVKNVIFIMLDTLQYNYLGCYGNKVVKTPNFDAFAKENILFENVYSEGLPTIPVRRAIMTGRYTLPFAGWQALTADDTTIADALWGKNVQSCIVFDTPPMRLPKYCYSRGFDNVIFCSGHELDHMTYKDLPEDPTRKAEDFTSASMIYNEKGEMIDDASQALIDEIDCYLKFRKDWKSDADNFVGVVARESIDWIKNKRNKDRSLFLWIDSFDPHEPWDAPSVWEGTDCPYDPDYEGNPLMLAPWTPVEGRITDRECEHIRALYAEKVSLCDKWVGKVIDTLKEEGLYDNSLIIIASDHGQPMGKGEHGHGIMRKCRPWPYEELVHVPLLMRVPEAKPQRISSFVQNVDIGATMMDALGLLENQDTSPIFGVVPVVLEDVQGISLFPLIEGKVDKIREHVISGYCGMSWSIITEDYSYIHWLKRGLNDEQPDIMNKDPYGEEDESIWTCTTGATQDVPEKDELYYRKEDPFQLNNIANKEPEKAKELLQMLKAEISSIKAS